EEERMLDLGSGAGFPGLVLKIVLPSLEVLLVEAKQKKAVFLDHIIRNLQLKNVKTVAARLVSTPDSEMINTYPLIISRAFASISGFLGLVREYSPPEGKVICMKGPRAEQEIREWEQTQPDSPFSIRSIHNYHLPFSGAERSLVIFGKSPSQLSDLRKLL
ncbi:MAG: 16S rRNA (guanine(527)-N(7))-methyltransferase RsmG, partial [Thermodesulfobacteriota bacterium]